MKKGFIFVAVAAVAMSVAFTGCFKKEAKGCFDKTATYTSGKEMSNCWKKEVKNIDADVVNVKDYATVIDIRTQKEIDEFGAIEGAKFMESGLVPFFVEKLQADKNAKVLIYCKNGGRGALATLLLERLGYKNVTNMDGGFEKYSKKHNLKAPKKDDKKDEKKKAA